MRHDGGHAVTHCMCNIALLQVIVSTKFLHVHTYVCTYHAELCAVIRMQPLRSYEPQYVRIEFLKSYEHRGILQKQSHIIILYV